MRGPVIVIDGLDGSGKQTQTELLYKRLQQEGRAVRLAQFPSYGKPWAGPVEAYLRGDFGALAGDVNPYAASTFYAVDRFCAQQADWGSFVESGGTLLCDRYTSSNAIHQGAKLPASERGAFFSWLQQLEHDKMGIFRPDIVLFLDMPLDCALKLMENRLNKATGAAQKDIHERDKAYLTTCREAACQAVSQLGWQVISCAESGAVRPILDIHEQIYKQLQQALPKGHPDDTL